MAKIKTPKARCPYCKLINKQVSSGLFGIEPCKHCGNIYAFTRPITSVDVDRTYKIEGINKEDESTAWAGISEEILGKCPKDESDGIEEYCEEIVRSIPGEFLYSILCAIKKDHPLLYTVAGYFPTRRKSKSSSFEIVDAVEDPRESPEPCNANCPHIDKLVDALVWTSGADDFTPGAVNTPIGDVLPGKARKGWLEHVKPLLDKYLSKKEGEAADALDSLIDEVTTGDKPLTETELRDQDEREVKSAKELLEIVDMDVIAAHVLAHLLQYSSTDIKKLSECIHDDPGKTDWKPNA